MPDKNRRNTNKPHPSPIKGETYQDPRTIQKQSHPIGDLYAMPDKKHRRIVISKPSLVSVVLYTV